jgi:hypothetical protein
MRFGVPAKRSKGNCFAPFSKAKLRGKLVKNRVFAVAPYFDRSSRTWASQDDQQRQ